MTTSIAYSCIFVLLLLATANSIITFTGDAVLDFAATDSRVRIVVDPEDVGLSTTILISTGGQPSGWCVLTTRKKIKKKKWKKKTCVEEN